MNDADPILVEVTAAILHVSRELRAADVRVDASLVNDLGMDSLRLSELVAELKRRFGKIDLTNWYVSAARQGADTVGGLVAFIAAARARS